MVDDHDLIGRLTRLKRDVQNLWSKVVEDDFEIALQKIRKVPQLFKKKGSKLKNHKSYSINGNVENLKFSQLEEQEEEEEKESHVKYYTTENSPLAKGAEKETPKGIDRFGEQEVVDLKNL